MSFSGSAASVGAWVREHRSRALLLAVAALLVLVALPLRLSSYSQSVLVDLLQYALLALGLNVVVGFAGLLDLGYVAFYAIGNYAFAIVTASRFSKALYFGSGLPVPPPPVFAKVTVRPLSLVTTF